MGWLNKTLFGISPADARVERLGFQVDDDRIRRRIEQIGGAFVGGYLAALEDDAPSRLAGRLRQQFEPEVQGFAFEGTGMGLVIADFAAPWRASRFQAFLDGPGADHIYTIYVGAGLAFARLPVRTERATERMADPLLRWLAMDGYGFHQGFFHWPRFVDSQEQPKRLSDYARCVFDNGLGRSLWFVKGANPERIANTIAAFAPERRPHLWAGIGLAAAYAGGVDGSALETLRELSGDFLPQLAQGVTFAAATRERAGNPAGHTELACEIVWGLTAKQAAAIPLAAMEGLAGEGGTPAYEVWRRRIHARFGIA